MQAQTVEFVQVDPKVIPQIRAMRSSLAEGGGYLSGLERGKRNPTIVTLHELALAVGVTHEELVKRDELASARTNRVR